MSVYNNKKHTGKLQTKSAMYKIVLETRYTNMYYITENGFIYQVWWCTPLFRRQRQEEFCEFQASLVCKMNFRPAKAVQ